jgi:hypothetical protein
MEGGKIPGWARVRHPKPTFDLENRRADLVCDRGLMSFEGLFITGKRCITVICDDIVSYYWYHDMCWCKVVGCATVSSWDSQTT